MAASRIPSHASWSSGELPSQGLWSMPAWGRGGGDRLLKHMLCYLETQFCHWQAYYSWCFPLSQLSRTRSPKPAFLLNTFSGVFRTTGSRIPKNQFAENQSNHSSFNWSAEEPGAENLQLTNHLRPCIPIFCPLLSFRKQMFSQLSSAPIIF